VEQVPQHKPGRPRTHDADLRPLRHGHVLPFPASQRHHFGAPSSQA
jgi:hypothetical protein